MDVDSIFANFHLLRYLYGVTNYNLLCKHPFLSTKIFLYSTFLFAKTNALCVRLLRTKSDIRTTTIFSVKHHMNNEADETFRKKAREQKTYKADQKPYHVQRPLALFLTSWKLYDLAIGPIIELRNKVICHKQAHLRCFLSFSKIDSRSLSRSLFAGTARVALTTNLLFLMSLIQLL